MRVGVLGCGYAASRHHLPALDAVAETAVVALADPDPVALAGAAAGREAAAHREATALLDDPAVEVVLVCTPSYLHEELAAMALAAGKHVLVEKPPALTEEGCTLLIETARAAPGQALVGFTYRWHRLVRAARRHVRAGDLGEVRALAATFTAQLREGAGGWRFDPARGGGVTMELGIHLVDIWRFLLEAEPGELRSVQDRGDVNALLSGVTPEGVVLGAELSRAAGANQELAIYGSHATLRVRLDRHDGLDLVPAGALPGDPARRAAHAARLLGSAPALVRSRRYGGDAAQAFRAQWRHMARVARGEADPAVTLEDGRRALAAVSAAREQRGKVGAGA